MPPGLADSLIVFLHKNSADGGIDAVAKNRSGRGPSGKKHGPRVSIATAAEHLLASHPHVLCRDLPRRSFQATGAQKLGHPDPE